MSAQEIAANVFVQDAFFMYEEGLFCEFEAYDKIFNEYPEFVRECSDEVFNHEDTEEAAILKTVAMMFEILSPLIANDAASRELDKDLERSGEL